MSNSPRSPIVHIAHGFADAEAWDIDQQVHMTPAERQMVAKELKRRFYGEDTPDVRENRQ